MAWKSFARTLVRKAGYDVLRVGDPRLDLVDGNFFNIAAGYSKLFSESVKSRPLPVNDLRSRLLMRLQGTPPTEAYYILDGLNRTREVPGDVCEFGVAQGETSALIANEIRDVTSKKLYLYDSFEGLPKPTEKDELKDDIFALGSMDAYTGTMSCPETMVRKRLREIGFEENRVVVHRGFVEADFASLGRLPDQVSFAYVDFDFYEPILVALTALHERLSPGAVVVVDDYDFFSTGAKTAVDEFIANHAGYRLTVPDKALGCFAVLYKD